VTLGLSWGATAGERALPLACDRLLPGAGVVAHRAITIDAPPDVVFRWLCQLRAAPYSYDVLDNLGRRSPRELTPGLERLAAGQRFMSLFQLSSFAPGEHITLRSRRVAVTYAVRAAGAGTRLLVRIRAAVPRVIASPLVLGDLVMMRKQLLTLRELAERTAA
jgi:hypothetical protein